MLNRILQFFRGKEVPTAEKTIPTASAFGEDTSSAQISLQDFSGLYGTVRLKLAGEDRLFLVTSLDAQALSFTYIGAFDHSRMNACHEGELVFEGHHIPIWICLVGQDHNSVQAQIFRTPATWNRDVDAFLDPIRLGKKLREIDATLMRQTSSAEHIRWFRAGPACDVYLTEDSKSELSLVQIWWEKNLIEWSVKQGLRSGIVHEPDRNEDSAIFKRSESFHYHKNVDADLVDWAYRFISASIAPKPIRKLFRTNPP